MRKLAHLRNDEVLAAAYKEAKSHREGVLRLLWLLVEIEYRHIFAEPGADSLFSFCVRELKMHETTASSHVNAARLLAEFPDVSELMASGELSITTAAQAHSFFKLEKKAGRPLSIETKKEILLRVAGQSSRDVARILVGYSGDKNRVFKERLRVVAINVNELRTYLSDLVIENLEFFKCHWSHQIPGATYDQIIARIASDLRESVDPMRKAERAMQRKAKAAERKAGVTAVVVKAPDGSISGCGAPGVTQVTQIAKDLNSSGRAGVSADRVTRKTDARVSQPSKRSESRALDEVNQIEFPVEVMNPDNLIELTLAPEFRASASASASASTSGSGSTSTSGSVSRSQIQRESTTSTLAPEWKPGSRAKVSARRSSKFDMEFSSVDVGSIRIDDLPAYLQWPHQNARSSLKNLVSFSADNRTRYIEAAVDHAVWIRDSGQCTYCDLRTGKPCGSRWQVESDHIVPFALGGEATVENLRLRCRTHNTLAAIRVYGLEFVRRMQQRSVGKAQAVYSSVGD